MARLLEQWEKDDDIEEGDLPEHRRPSPPIDFSKVDPSKPQDLLKMSKKGKTVMVFATVSGNPTEKETEEVTSLWQGSLFNANFDVQRFVVGSNRVIFMLRDGSYAWEIKDFLTLQERCEDVTVEGQVFPGKAANKANKANKEKEQNETKKKKDKNAANRVYRVQEEMMWIKPGREVEGFFDTAFVSSSEVREFHMSTHVLDLQTQQNSMNQITELHYNLKEMSILNLLKSACTINK
ncbi:hypothetical protein KOW79_009000 [Hemibagrus wyckioides]|uniref:LRP chaperone MESD n=1 Tax=Hemibagrus wyckioides TaxID=337641 RepID=A0A9D3SPY5_9TELE|nr:hypothetical protein KOW79_009000 [Hemibagrus wyckioides]